MSCGGAAPVFVCAADEGRHAGDGGRTSSRPRPWLDGQVRGRLGEWLQLSVLCITGPGAAQLRAERQEIEPRRAELLDSGAVVCV